MNLTTIDPDPNGLLDHLCNNFKMTAERRREKAKQYNDERNVQAAERLEALAGTVQNVSPQMTRKYVALHDQVVGGLTEDGNFGVTEAEHEAMREIGFHRFPDTAEEFIRDLVAIRAHL